jgi:hypothetical protein
MEGEETTRMELKSKPEGYTRTICPSPGRLTVEVNEIV